MQIPLFLDPTIKLEKTASSTKLEEDPDRWPIEIIKIAYKSIPSLKSYEADVELDRVDAARGYAVGKMLLFPTGMTKEAASGEDKLISLPIIIRDHELAPLDVYSHKGAMYPMDEEGVQEIMIRPQTFSGVADKGQFTGTNLFGQLTPPNTDHQYNAGSLAKLGSAGMWKLAFANANSTDVENFKTLLKSEVGLRHAFMSNPVLQSYVQDSLDFKEKTASERRAERVESMRPTVVQFSYDHGKFFVKTANHHCWSPRTEVTDRFAAQKTLSEDNFNRLLSDGHVTLTANPVNVERVHEKVASVADRVGTYRVWSGPHSYDGIVIPEVVDFSNRPMSLQIFAGADRHAMQEKVAGVLDREVTLPLVEPRGLGVFVYQEGDRAVAYEPVRVMNKVASANQWGHKAEKYICKKASTGETVYLTPVNFLQEVVETVPGDYAIPSNFKFLPLQGSQIRTSAPDVAQLFEHQKVASSSVSLESNGHVFRLSGSNDLPFRGQEYSARDVEFVLGGLGVSGKQARDLVKTAAARGRVVVGKTRQVQTEEQRGYAMLKTAAATVQRFGKSVPKVSTFKEVAVLVSPKAQEMWKKASISLPKETVDAILSLNFMTPENASVYISYLPILEKTSSVLAELLVASRLGMDDVREAAALNAMTQVNAVVKGLGQLSEKIQ